MQLILTPEIEQLAQQLATAGEYPSIQDVIRDGLLVLQDLQEQEQKNLVELRMELAIGLAQADQGRLAPLDPQATLARVRQRRAAKR